MNNTPKAADGGFLSDGCLPAEIWWREGRAVSAASGADAVARESPCMGFICVCPPRSAPPDVRCGGE